MEIVFIKNHMDFKYFCNDYHVLTTGDGGIYSCVDDLLLWVQSFDNEIIFRKKTIETIFLREKLNDGTACIYTFGWFAVEKNNKKVKNCDTKATCLISDK